MDLTPDLEKRLRQLVAIFLAENAKINLSAFRTEDSCWIGNILDSLAGTDVISELATQNPKLKVLDLGTGGGFPLLPLAMSFPEVWFTGMDATQKKMDAVKRIADAMQLKNVELVNGRAEALGREKKYREQFDVVLSRAVADLSTLLEYCSPFVKKNGGIILWKSMNIEEELESALHAKKELHCDLTGTRMYELPGDFGKRQLLIFEKTAKLSDTYPRAVGIPSKKPL